jgi:hypothetical protein
MSIRLGSFIEAAAAEFSQANISSSDKPSDKPSDKSLPKPSPKPSPKSSDKSPAATATRTAAIQSQAPRAFVPMATRPAGRATKAAA